jgi:hypothetical protein
VSYEPSTVLKPKKELCVFLYLLILILQHFLPSGFLLTPNHIKRGAQRSRWDGKHNSEPKPTHIPHLPILAEERHREYRLCNYELGGKERCDGLLGVMLLTANDVPGRKSTVRSAIVFIYTLSFIISSERR